MSFLRRLFSIKKKKRPEDVVAFARSIERLIDRTSLEIFREYRSVLLKEPNVFIVPAVWGATKEGELNDIQKEIYTKTAPVIQEILSMLHQDDLSVPQEFAVGYIVRGFFISKIIYMIEFYRNLSAGNPPDINDGNEENSKSNKVVDLKDMEPLGRA